MIFIKELKSVNLCIRVTPTELETINDNIRKLGVNNPTHYLRTLLVKEHIVQTDMTDIKNILTELNRIGNNINQITKKCNQTGNINSVDIESINKNFEDVKTKINKELEKKLELNL